MSLRIKPKIGSSSSIIIKWTRSILFDLQKMILELVQCLINKTYHFKLAENQNSKACFDPDTNSISFFFHLNWMRRHTSASLLHTQLLLFLCLCVCVFCFFWYMWPHSRKLDISFILLPLRGHWKIQYHFYRSFLVFMSWPFYRSSSRHFPLAD